MFMTLLLLDGPDNKFQDRNSKDQTPVLMMKPFSPKREEEKDSTILISFKNKLNQSMVTPVFTTLLPLDGLDNKFQDRDSKDQTPVLMMKLFFTKKCLPTNTDKCKPENCTEKKATD